MDSSEAIRHCFTQGPPAARNVTTMSPYPPYAVDRPRPLSAPLRKPPSSQPVWHDSRADIIPRKQRKFILSLRQSSGSNQGNRYTPYAGRLREAFTNENELRTAAYPRVENGKKVLLPEYSALTDPHLADYYARKFNLVTIPRPPTAGRRPASAPAKRNSNSRGQRKVSEVVYKVSVTTGNKKNAGTDAHVYIQLRGSKGKMPKKKLTKKSTKTQSGFIKVKFSRNTTKSFKLKSAELGDLQSLIVEHDGLEKRHSWFLESIAVTNLSTKQTWTFPCNQWLSLFESDCQLSRTLDAVDNKKYGKTEYEVVVITGDKKGAGTDANVFVTLYGVHSISKKMQLSPPVGSNPFDRGSSDMFRLKCNNVGALKKIRIEHDNTGFGPGWFLERVVVTDLKNPKKGKFYFPCHQWLAKDEGDGAISRDLLGSRDPAATRKGYKYIIHIFTGKKRGAGTDANVSITIFGEGGDSGERRLKSSKNNFERGQEDQFAIESYPLGPLKKIRIGHDNSMVGAGWFLDKVIIDDVEMNATYEFPCNRWLAKDEDDGLITRELYCGKNAGSEGKK
ncbi:Lipoxygenase-likey domain-containing protein 1 [Holothuria leucospilota]|uniref:Lipoxygenase-likey domain-containing protein 1 n=1 Tax=Holothuria leucospilota TaxID=206669 RepID=A0A9Q1CTS0_HOLLE|nr:Lipoxygenase-likey domain-containing protein 1 [Holothuria leucospilota]